MACTENQDFRDFFLNLLLATGTLRALLLMHLQSGMQGEVAEWPKALPC